ncbi:MAG TPA: 5'-3' exonuclease H3TH domain-containing protein [Solirubrobacteraceae bacterium]|jgi:DNA polymerase-1|nr:5'-3' exonuclease H3TH domain-containing protein [Solirubrobacteraceae bacterium]
MPAPLLIADVPWLLYRSFHGLPKSIKGADGRPVNALLGTVNALLAAIEASAPRAVVACFGAEDAAYRKALYPPYHAQREPMPAELAHQWVRAPGLLESLGWSIADAGELEADDAIGAHARAESSAGGRALILSGDRDMYQAVDERVAVLEMSKSGAVELGPTEVVERYGVTPAQVPDFIALRGDPSDGLPGAPGIGAKTAAELLRAHGTLDALLAVAARQCEESGFGTLKGTSELRRRTAETLHEHDELLRTFKRVATLEPIDVQRPADAGTDFAGGAVAARELGMKRLAERLDASAMG